MCLCLPLFIWKGEGRVQRVQLTVSYSYWVAHVGLQRLLHLEVSS